jgi:hypothetical protein
VGWLIYKLCKAVGGGNHPNQTIPHQRMGRLSSDWGDAPGPRRTEDHGVIIDQRD